MTVVENYSPLAQELNRLAGITDILEYQDEQGAANVWAGTSGLGLLAALNKQVDETRTPDQYKGLNEVCNELAGTTGLEAIPALSTINPAEYLLQNKAVYYIDSTDSSASTQTVTNLGTAGSLLPTTVGSATTTDSNDPKFLDHTGTNYVYLPGVNNNRLTVPDSAALDITGDLELIINCTIDTLTGVQAALISKQATGQISYHLREDNSQQLRFDWSEDGTTVKTALSTVAITTVYTAGDNIWIKVTLDVDNGASGNDVKFYTSTDGVTYTQLGTTVTTAGTTSIFAGTQDLWIGHNAITGSHILTGKVFRVIVKDGIDGTTVLDVDTSVITTGAATSFTAVTGQTVTINRSTSGRKTVAVTQPVWLFGTDDYMEVNNRYLTHTGTNYLYLPGVASNTATTPDAAPLDITGDIDIRVKVALDDWTPAAIADLVAKAGTNDSYRFRILTTGILRLEWVTTGPTTITKDSTVATGIADGATKWVRATLDVDNGASGNDVKFFTSDDGTNWTQLGSTVTTAGVTSINNTTSVLTIGGAGSAAPARGKFFRAQVLDGIDGTVAFDANFETSITSLNQASFTESSTNAATVTINRSGDGFESAGITAAGYLYPGATNTFTASATNHLDFGLSDSFTLVAAYRLWATLATNVTRIAKKINTTAATQGYLLGSDGTTGSLPRTQIGDGTNGLSATSGARTSGAATVTAAVRNVTTDNVTTYTNGTAGTPVTDNTTGTLTNFEQLRIGRLSGTGTSYADMEGYAFALFRKPLTAREVKVISDYFTTKVGA